MPHPSSSRPVRAALLSSLILCAALPCDAAERLGVMGLRVSPPGAVSGGTSQAFNLMVWQAISGRADITAVAEHQIGSSMGAGSATALTGCQDDACMAQIGGTAGLDRILYAVAAKEGAGFALYVRGLGVEPVQVLAERKVSCAACGEADLLQLIGQVDVAGIATAGRTAAARAISSLAPADGASGSAVIQSDPPGATVLLDGAALGQTPLQIPAMAPGMYALLLDMPGHEEQLAELTIRAKKEAKVEVKMTAMAQVRIAVLEGAPAATVYVDGRPRGIAPVEVDSLSAGEHEVIVMAPGHRETRLSVPLAPGQVADLIVGLVPADAPTGTLPPTGLLVESLPTGAAVRVEGKVHGFTPLKLDILQPGPRKVEIYMPWHEGVAHDVEVVDRAQVRLLVPLTSLPFSPVPKMDGRTERELGNHKSGARHGAWIKVSDDGRRISERRYDRGAPQGLQAVWYDAPGSPRHWAGSFHRGEPHGAWLQWGKDGTIQAAGWYHHGALQVGEKVAAAISQAELLDKPECPDGAYAASGVNLRPNGTHADGPVKTLRRWCETAPGKLHGPRHDRSLRGKFWCATDYDKGLAHGRSVCWNDDGTKRSERRLVRGHVKN